MASFTKTRSEGKPLNLPVIGWDIGGANLKAVALNAGGELQQTLQVACPLWQGLDQLEAALRTVLTQFNPKKPPVRHAVTMTGELVDLFQNRHQGVFAIATLFTQVIDQPAFFYTAQHNKMVPKFVTLADVNQHSALIASANWHASATLIAQRQPNVLLIDIGGTTTDIVPIVHGAVATNGFSDAERMQQDCLVYTGVVRTPVMALAQTLEVDGIHTNVAAEYFATMADVYRLTGDLQPEFDLADTADSKAKTTLASARRLARMVAYDVEDKPMRVWHDLAQTCKTLQIQRIKSAVLKHLQADMPMIGAGAGAFLVQHLAADLQRNFISLPQALGIALEQTLEQCLPAYAVAKLLIHEK